MEKFVVISEARSGTHFLQTVLNSHPDIHSYLEVLPGMGTTDFHRYWLDRIREDEGNILPDRRPKIFEDYLTALFNRSAEKKAVGFDIKYHQLDWIPYLGIYEGLKKHNVHVIHLIRLNLLKLYLSAIFNNHKEKLNRGNHTTRKVPPATATLYPKEMFHFFETIHSNIHRIRDTLSKLLSYLEIYYENCFETPELNSQTITPDVLDRIYDFLGIDERRYDLKTDLVKMNPPHLEEMISNYDEIVSVIKDSKWSYLLEESLGIAGSSTGPGSEETVNQKPWNPRIQPRPPSVPPTMDRTSETGSELVFEQTKQQIMEAGSGVRADAVLEVMQQTSPAMTRQEAVLRLMIDLPEAG